MISASSRLRLAALAALLASSLLHVAAMAVSPDLAQDVLVEGGADAPEAALGNDFADLIKAGDTLEPVEATEVAAASPSSVTGPVRQTSRLEPLQQPREPVAPVASTARSVTVPDEDSLKPVDDKALISPSTPESLQKLQPQPAAASPPPQKTAPVKPADRLEPVEDASPVEAALPANVPTPVAKPERPRKPARKVAGNKNSKSEVNSKAGKQDGKATAKAASSGTVKSKKASSKSGNAAAANYPGKVFAKIARTRQRNAGGRGVVHVSFHVSASGQAVRVAVSRSSGNARVDKAALAHIKRAAPFPKPPSGARTRFVIPIEFRR